MVSSSQRPKLIAIVGPTASGKSKLAMAIAKKFNGEIICADSRTVYKGMDRGTAKPSAADQAVIKHWGLDLIEPGESYSAAKFTKYAKSCIADIEKRGKLPILVGGTGLYIDGLLFDFSFIAARNIGLRRKLEKLSVYELQKIIAQEGLELPENARNHRYLVRTIERRGLVGKSEPKPDKGILVVGLWPPDEVLRTRIASRAATMFRQGLVKETKDLLNRYGEAPLGSTAGIAYNIIASYLNGQISRQVAIDLIVTKDWQYARRQKTWFKRNSHIKWFSNPNDARKAVQKQLLNT